MTADGSRTHVVALATEFSRRYHILARGPQWVAMQSQLDRIVSRERIPIVWGAALSTEICP